MNCSEFTNSEVKYNFNGFVWERGAWPKVVFYMKYLLVNTSRHMLLNHSEFSNSEVKHSFEIIRVCMERLEEFDSKISINSNQQ